MPRMLHRIKQPGNNAEIQGIRRDGRLMFYQRTKWGRAKKTVTKICQTCGKEYEPNSKYSSSQQANSKYCSNYCRLRRPRQLKPTKIKICAFCGKEYQTNRNFSIAQYKVSKFCSAMCCSKSQKINDGMTKGQRRTRRLGLPKRGTPEWLEKIRSTTKNAMLKPEIQFKLHNPHGPLSLEHRIKLSNIHAGKLPKNMMFNCGSYPNIKRGDYECSKGTMYFRSMWEANYALYLDFLVQQGRIKSWEYEVDVFVFNEIQFGTRSYRPDFKVFTNDGLFEYHEIKGYMDGKSKTKLRRMAKYYPDVKLILIDSACYRDIKKKIGKMLNFY